MNYVYILQSVSDPDQFYTGLCADVGKRVAAHNRGQSSHTSKYRPWILRSSHWFEDEAIAVAFEQYLKSGSGRAFSAKRLRGSA